MSNANITLRSIEEQKDDKIISNLDDKYFLNKMSESIIIANKSSTKEDIDDMTEKNELDCSISLNSTTAVNANILPKTNSNSDEEKIKFNKSTKLVSPTDTLASNDFDVNDLNALNYSSSEESNKNTNDKIKMNKNRNDILLTRLDYRNDDLPSSSNSISSNKIIDNETNLGKLSPGSGLNKDSNEIRSILKHPKPINYTKENIDESYDNLNNSIDTSEIIANNQYDESQFSLNGVKINSSSIRESISSEFTNNDKLLKKSQLICSDEIEHQGNDYLSSYNTKSFIIADNKKNSMNGENETLMINKINESFNSLKSENDCQHIR